MTIRILRADVRLIDLKTRLPFRYGIATMTETPHAFVRVVAEVDGVTAEGIAADHLPPKWFTKNIDQKPFDEIGEMLDVIGHAADSCCGLSGVTVFDVWRALYDGQSDWGRNAKLPPLLTNFGTSLVERSLIDAFCRAKRTTFADAVHSNALGIRLGDVDAELADYEPADLLPEKPLRRLTIRQTLGLADTLTDAEIPAADRVNDGLPQSLAGLIRQYGLRHFKIKISGDADADVQRLLRFVRVVEDCQVADFRFTLDGNELFRSLVEFRDYWDELFRLTKLRNTLPRLLFVEQPLHRDVALEPSSVAGLRDWHDRPTIIIDESDAELDSLPRALSLGYDGTSHKNCKGVFKSLINVCRLERRRRQLSETCREPARPLVMSVEDLVTIGPVALLQDLTVAAVLGVNSVERNGHHFFAGLSAFADDVQRAVLNAHSDLYRQSESGWPTLRIENGTIAVDSILAAPFGVGFDLDVTSLTPIEEYRRRE
ncbi:MAG: hypothetical protein IID45_10015 [Planctomycetes bacterium]|nr:hypothetical protein [Planctomycetota bacterium]